MTGVLLTILIIVIYIFATQMSRRYIFKAFWLTHKLIIPLYILAVLHGSSVLVQKPMFWCYFIGPVIAFVIDKMISLSRKRTEISVVRAEKLPSGEFLGTISCHKVYFKHSSLSLLSYYNRANPNLH